MRNASHTRVRRVRLRVLQLMVWPERALRGSRALPALQNVRHHAPPFGGTPSAIDEKIVGLHGGRSVFLTSGQELLHLLCHGDAALDAQAGKDMHAYACSGSDA